MSLARSLALRLPAIRRLVEGRDQLIVELQRAREALGTSETQASALLSAQQALVEGRDQLIVELQRAREALGTSEAQASALLSAQQTLEEDTAEMRLARLENRLFITEYSYFPSARPIKASAGGRQLEAMFRRSQASIEETVRGIARHTDKLARVPHAADGSLRPFWQNDWFPPFDGAALYGLIAENKPRRYIEVGSGISTRFARQAITDLELATKIVSIDPHPHNAVQGLCDETIVSRMEDLPASFWAGLSAEDMLFIDNSHRSFPGSDVTVFFTEILPSLPAGVIYGVHDICLPSDYPAEWNYRFYNEQYLLMAYLLGGASEDQILLPLAWTCEQIGLHGLLSALWSSKDLFAGIRVHGSAFWARRGKRSHLHT